jgi:hypothetical protein
MLQRATVPPDGGIPADCTDAWSLGAGPSRAVHASLLTHTREHGAGRDSHGTSGCSRHTPHHCHSTAVETTWRAAGESPMQSILLVQLQRQGRCAYALERQAPSCAPSPPAVIALVVYHGMTQRRDLSRWLACKSRLEGIILMRPFQPTIPLTHSMTTRWRERGAAREESMEESIGETFPQRSRW